MWLKRGWKNQILLFILCRERFAQIRSKLNQATFGFEIYESFSRTGLNVSDKKRFHATHPYKTFPKSQSLDSRKNKFWLADARSARHVFRSHGLFLKNIILKYSKKFWRSCFFLRKFIFSFVRQNQTVFSREKSNERLKQ